MCKPFVKWAGGKNQLLSELLRLMPQNYNTYIEPFVGGGALFFKIKPQKAIINDYNAELINVYRVIKYNVEELIKSLKKHKNTKEYYYKIRNIDRDKNKYRLLSPIEKASRFIFLNKTCYNGLYRVNSKGQFNVPFGNYKNPNFIEEENLKKCSNVLKNVIILNDDFEIIKEYIQENDFVYFDPPYMPISKTSSFTSYTHNGFSKEDQIRLKKLCDFLTKHNVYFMLSNSYNNFILELYKNYKINIVYANRAINCKANGRGKIKEVIIINY